MTPLSVPLISARSRRLRTTGIVLVVMLLLLSLYGAFALMPSLHSDRLALAAREANVHSVPASSHSKTKEAAATLQREKRVLLTKAAFIYGYWSVCGLLAISAFLVAWLDFREVTQRYQQERRVIWSEMASRSQSPRDGPTV